MNVDTGELYRLLSHQQEELINQIGAEKEKNIKEYFEQVPTEFEEEAMQELGDNDYVKVDMTKNTPLVNWAKKENKKKKKRKAKMAKKSKRNNRKNR